MWGDIFGTFLRPYNQSENPWVSVYIIWQWTEANLASDLGDSDCLSIIKQSTDDSKAKPHRACDRLATETNGDSSNYLYSFSLQLVGISIRFINWLFTSFGGEWNRGEQPVYERDTEEDGEQN